MHVKLTYRKLGKFLDSVKKSLLSLLFDLGGLFAGFLFSTQLNFSNAILWSVILYPGILCIRGAIGGAFSGNLTTGLHEGSIKPSFRKNTYKFRILVESITLSTFLGSILISLFSYLSASFVIRDVSKDFMSMILVSMSTMSLSILTISPFTIVTAFLAYRRGLDPDTLVYPITSTIADIILTLVYVITLRVYLVDKTYILFIDGVFFIMVIFILIRDYDEKELISSLKENFIMLLLVSLIINVAGSTLGGIVDKFNVKGLYILYPALIDTIGDIGSIVGSVATTMLILGYARPNISLIVDNLENIMGAWSASLIMFLLYAFISFIVSPLANLLLLIYIVFSTNIIAVPLIVLISHLTAILTYRKGFNPDNFVIPVEASLSDTITTLSLLLSLLFLS